MSSSRGICSDHDRVPSTSHTRRGSSHSPPKIDVAAQALCKSSLIRNHCTSTRTCEVKEHKVYTYAYNEGKVLATTRNARGIPKYRKYVRVVSDAAAVLRHKDPSVEREVVFCRMLCSCRVYTGSQTASEHLSSSGYERSGSVQTGPVA